MKPKRTQKPKIRLARKSDRDHAATIARLYREQTPCTVSRGPDGAAAFSPMTGEDLAYHLESFAEHGTFTPASEYRIHRDVLLRLRYAERRAAGDTYEVAVENCAGDLGRESTVRAAIKAGPQKGGTVLK